MWKGTFRALQQWRVEGFTRVVCKNIDNPPYYFFRDIKRGVILVSGNGYTHRCPSIPQLVNWSVKHSIF